MGYINKIKVVDSINTIRLQERNIYLIHDGWNDWFKYETLFSVVYIDDDKKQNFLGAVKIAQINQNDRSPQLPDETSQFDDRFFSLGAYADYYEELKQYPFREELLRKMRDIAFDIELYEKVKRYDVTTESLMRDITETTLLGQFHRIAHGGAKLTNYKFEYCFPDEKNSLVFNVESNSMPPTNIHVLIGKNGVGKTTILKRMIYAAEKHDNNKNVGDMRGDEFSNIIFVSFSAFDMSIDVGDFGKDELTIPYKFVGLINKKSIKSEQSLAEDFVESLYHIVTSVKKKLWNDSISVLESDITFTELHVQDWSEIDEIKMDDYKEKRKIFYENTIDKFKKLSSGHKVILLTIAKLVELVEEKTLVLLDEPEEHLHPPLVSAFIRCLSDLLIYRNGVGVIATHSAVIVQEVPKKCVWIIRRSGEELVTERPEQETFGENLGELISDIFGYEVTNSGFHRMLKDVSEKESSYQYAIEYFDNELGKEARSILKSYMYSKEVGE